MCTTICTAAKPRITAAVNRGKAEDHRGGEAGRRQHLGHHQPERDGGEHHRQQEADDVALRGEVVAAVVFMVVIVADGMLFAHGCSSEMLVHGVGHKTPMR